MLLKPQNKQALMFQAGVAGMCVKGKQGIFPAVLDRLSGVKTGCEWQQQTHNPKVFFRALNTGNVVRQS